MELEGRKITIDIDARWKLVTDQTGWEILQYREAQKGPSKGQLGWYGEGHFDTLEWALRGLWKRMLQQGTGRADLKQLADRVEQAQNRILTALGNWAAKQTPAERSAQASPWDAAA